MPRVRRRGALGALAALALGCRRQPNSRELLIFAAASLTDAFTELARAFESDKTGVSVRLSFGGSQALRTQIENGAQPQLFASANGAHVQALLDLGLVRAPTTFAQNRLVIVVPPDNPAAIGDMSQLPRAHRLVLCDHSVPVGDYTKRSLARAATAFGADFSARVEARVVSREANARLTLQKVVLGEADAAVVYASDARAAGDNVATIDIPARYNVTATYPIALVEPTASPLAETFVSTLVGTKGKSILAHHGFVPPSV